MSPAGSHLPRRSAGRLTCVREAAGPPLGHAPAHAPWLFGSLRGYRPGWLRGDVLAGLTVWAVLAPKSLAYATIAGVSPVVGLYAAVPSLVL